MVTKFFSKNLVVMICVLFSATIAHAAFDPVTEDPAIDKANPPSVVELQIPSGESIMNGHLYVANGAGPHPTAIFLHGFPGNEKNLDLAQVLRRAGYNSLFFHYRGSWGSSGTYGIESFLEDTGAAIEFLKARAAAGEHRIDASKIALVGHSFGGFNTLITRLENPAVTCSVALAPANLFPRLLEIDINALPKAPILALGGYSYADIAKEGAPLAARLDYAARMKEETAGPMLLISGTRDRAVTLDTQTPIAAASGNVPAFEHIILDADHSFSGRRIELSRIVLNWMNANCR